MMKFLLVDLITCSLRVKTGSTLDHVPITNLTRLEMQVIPIIGELLGIAIESIDDLKSRIKKVGLAPFESNMTHEKIIFELDGKTYIGDLLGRNADLLIGFDAENDVAIAARVLLDGNARAI